MASKGILRRCCSAVYDIMSFQHSQMTESDQRKEEDVKGRGRIHLCAWFHEKSNWSIAISGWWPNNTHWAEPLLTCYSKGAWNTDITSAFAIKIFRPWKWNESRTIEMHEARVLCGPISLSNFYKHFWSILWSIKTVGETVQPHKGHMLSTLLENTQQTWAISEASWQLLWS